MKTKTENTVNSAYTSLANIMVLEKIESPVAQLSSQSKGSVAFDSAEEDESLSRVKRLYELGLRPGLQIQIIGKVSFNSVTIIQFGQTRLALNEQEMLCLHGRS